MGHSYSGTHNSGVFPIRHPHLPNPSKKERTRTTTSYLCISYKSVVSTVVAWGFSLQKPSRKRGDKTPNGSQPGNGTQTDFKTAQSNFVCLFVCIVPWPPGAFVALGNTSCGTDVKSPVAKSLPFSAPGGCPTVVPQNRSGIQGPPPGPGFISADRERQKCPGGAGACRRSLNPLLPVTYPWVLSSGADTHQVLGAEATHPVPPAGTGGQHRASDHPPPLPVLAPATRRGAAPPGGRLRVPSTPPSVRTRGAESAAFLAVFWRGPASPVLQTLTSLT